MRLRIGSRGSQLALWQANHIADRLRAAGNQVEIEVIKTTGDKVLDIALAKIGTKGMFTKEIEDALASRDIDLAVHSLKDLPTELDPRFELAAITEREDPRDVLVSLASSGLASLADLPERARIGTSSLRRQAQLAAARADLRVVPLRGNVDTRLRKLREGQFDAIILAAAGLNRLDVLAQQSATDRGGRLAATPLAADVMCPAAGQGALAVEIRSGDRDTRAAVASFDHPPSRAATTCERALLAALGGGCQVPIGALAECRSDGSIHLEAMVASPDGAHVLRVQQSGGDPVTIGWSVASALLARGARQMLQDVYGAQVAMPQQP